MSIALRICRAVVLAALALTCGACPRTSDAAPESQFGIQGTVRDDLTGHALSGANVIFVSDTLDKSEARSDGNGHYALDATVRAGVSFGTVHAELPSYQPSPDTTVYFDGTSRTVDLRLRPKGP